MHMATTLEGVTLLRGQTKPPPPTNLDLLAVGYVVAAVWLAVMVVFKALDTTNCISGW